MDSLSTNPNDAVNAGESPIAEEPKRRGRPPKVLTAADEEETVEISRSELSALLKRVEKLENPGIIEKVKRVTEHVGYLRGWEGKLVVGIGGAMENHLVHESDINRIQLPVVLQDLNGNREEKKVPYLYFLENSDKWNVKITSMSRVEREEVDPRRGGGGVTQKAYTDKEGRLMPDRNTGEPLELVVTYVDISVKTTVMEGPFAGVELDFDNAHLNAINC